MDKKECLLGVSEMQTYLFNTGENYRSYEFLGCHRVEIDGCDVWRFAVWAPNAQSVKVACDRNDWLQTHLRTATYINMPLQRLTVLYIYAPIPMQDVVNCDPVRHL